MIKADSILVALPGRVKREWSDLFDWPELTVTGLRIVAALLVGWVAYRVLRLVLRRIERSVADDDPGVVSVREQRAMTLIGLVRNMGLVVISVLVMFMVLGALGIDLGPLLAGAGVIGLAISFGAQSLVKDIISGLFILFENQFGVGDVIRIEPSIGGVVERMTLRVVVLRDVQGVVHVIPNGEIKRVSNLTRTWSRVVLDVGVAYDEDSDRVMEVMRDVGRELWEDPQWRPLLVEPVEVPGIESFGESAVNIRIMAKTVPLKQWEVARELRRRIKRRFDEEGISLPFPHRTLRWAEGQSPAALPPAHLTESQGDGSHQAM